VSILKNILKHFLKGVLVLAPVAITVFVIYKIITIVDSIFINILEPLHLYFPGIGIILSFIIITLIGMLASNWLTGKIFSYIDNIFTKLPLIKVIYTTIRDTISSFLDGRKGFSKLAIVNIPNSDIKLLGFITNKSLDEFGLNGYISVYLMQSMQWAGNLILVPEEMVTPVDVNAEEAIKFIASAGIISNKKYK
jgi:uncharacterized membrane protein